MITKITRNIEIWPVRQVDYRKFATGNWTIPGLDGLLEKLLKEKKKINYNQETVVIGKAGYNWDFKLYKHAWDDAFLWSQKSFVLIN